MLATFGIMRWWGLSANIMSLGGLAIAIGILVDCAVVVVENVEHRLAHERKADLSERIQMTLESTRRGRHAASLWRGDHHHRLPPASVAGGPGGSTVRAGRPDDRLCDGLGPALVADRRAGAQRDHPAAGSEATTLARAPDRGLSMTRCSTVRCNRPLVVGANRHARSRARG